MSEMLGNQYFMARKFELALPQFNEVLAREPENLNCLKKAIICHTQLKQVAEAFDLFLKVMNIDPFIIINTRPEDDDCPCPELVVRLEETEPTREQLTDYYTTLGILYLYCNLDRSLHYFQKSLKIHPLQNAVLSIINQLHQLNNVPEV